MKLLLQNGNSIEVAKKWKQNPNWLDLEEFIFILNERPEILNHISPEDIDREIVIEGLRNFLNDVSDNNALKFNLTVSNNKIWKPIISIIIKEDLTEKSFLKNDLAIDFLEEQDYVHIAKKIIPNIKINKNTKINTAVQKHLTEKQIISMLDYSLPLSFNDINEKNKTLIVCQKFIEREKNRNVLKLYLSLPEEFKDDKKIAIMVCEQNKQNYKQLTLNAQKHEIVINNVINNVIYPTGDHDSFHTDETAIKIKELPIEAVLNINNIHLIKTILLSNKSLLNIKEIKNKWLIDEINQAELIELYDFFNDSDKLKWQNKIKDMNSREKATFLKKLSNLKNIIVDEKNINESLEILVETHKIYNSFAQAIKVTGLLNLVNTNINELSNFYMDIKQRESMIRTLHFTDWLLKQNKNDYQEKAIELLALVVENNKNALNVNLNYNYQIESTAIKKVESKVYDYLDTKEEIKQNNLKKNKY